KRFSLVCTDKKRLHSMGVKVSETNPEAKIATANVMLNSRNNLPLIPGIKRSGINTATNDNVIDKIVKLICLEPIKLAARGVTAFSWHLTIFSNTTMASSTTNPTDKVNASNERRSRLKSARYMMAKVPNKERGRAALVINDSESLPKLK